MVESEWDAASLYDKFTYSVLNPILNKGFTKKLKLDDLLHVPKRDVSSTMLRELKDAYINSKKFYFIPRLMVAFLKAHKFKWGFILSTTVISGLTRIALPLSLIFMLDALENKSDKICYLWAMAISLISLLQIATHHTLYAFSMRLGANLKISTKAFIYDTLFKLEGSALQTTMTGKMVNMISNDVARFDEFAIFANYIFEIYFELVIMLLVLIYILDVPSAFVGVGSSLILFPILMYLAKLFSDFRLSTAIATDTRVRHISEIIDGIATVKSYAWELPFFKMITKLRNKEIKQITKAQTIRSANQSVLFFNSSLAGFLTFLTYWGNGGELTIPKVFAASSLLSALKIAVGRHWLRSMETYSEAFSSCQRIEEFLDKVYGENNEVTTEKEEKIVYNQLTDSDAIFKIKNGTFYHGVDPNQTVLKNINISVSKGEILTIVGPVGSGKSSLLLAALGELNQSTTENSLYLKDGVTTAYCSQRPFILAASIKSNISLVKGNNSEDFRSPSYIDEELYKRAVESTLLVDDFKQWAAYDDMEIGEKGTSISGGQKARLSLARAVYSDADLYILDDPLSAVDAHVGKALMLGCIKENLRDRNKAVVLVTHQLQFLQHSDKILVLGKTGEQSFFGTYSEFIENKDVLNYLQYNIENTEEISEESLVYKKCAPYSGNVNNQAALKEEDAYESDEEDEEDSETPPESPSSPTDEVSKRNQSIANRNKRTVIQKEKAVASHSTLSLLYMYFKSGGLVYGIFIILLMFFSQAILMITDYWLKWWASETFYSQGNTYNIWIYAILVFFVILVGFYRSYFWFIYSLNCSSYLHKHSFWAVLHSPMLFFNSNPTGRILNRFSKDQNQADEVLSLTFFSFAECAIFCLAGIVLVCVSIPWLTIAMPFLFYAFYLLRTKYLKSSKQIKHIEAIACSPIYSDFSATLDGMITLRAYKLQEKMNFNFHTHLNNDTRALFSYILCSRWLGLRLDSEITILLTLVAFFSVVLRNSIDVGLIGFTLLYTVQLAGLFQWAVRQSAELEAQLTSIERINQYANLEPEHGYKEDLNFAMASLKNNSAMNVNPETAKLISNMKGEVALKNLTVTYRQDLEPVLKNLSVTFPPGSKVGICGRTGSGKSSTLISLLRLNIIQSGDIQVDGESIIQMNLEKARSIISIIPQEPHLFSGTIRFNLDPFNIYSDSQIWDALKDAHISDFIKSTGQGLKYIVEEGGKNFSVGQRQLLSLARAILRNCKVILMDEVTASIDFYTDKLIQETIRTSECLKNATIITVAHRLRTIADSDYILVIERGELAEFDNPYNLLNKENSFYKQLAIESGEYDEIYNSSLSTKKD